MVCLISCLKYVHNLECFPVTDPKSVDRSTGLSPAKVALVTYQKIVYSGARGRQQQLHLFTCSVCFLADPAAGSPDDFQISHRKRAALQPNETRAGSPTNTARTPWAVASPPKPLSPRSTWPQKDLSCKQCVWAL